MKIDRELYVNLTNIAYSVVIAGFIIVVITTGMTNENSLTALISGYSGLLAALLFLVILNWINMDNVGLLQRIISLFPFLIIMFIILLLVTYLSLFFDRIVSNKVSSYYYSFSMVSTIFLAAQIMLLFSELISKHFESTKQIGGKMLSLLMLLGVINGILVITLGIILKFYSTQG